MMKTFNDLIVEKALPDSTTHIIFTDGSGKGVGAWAAVIALPSDVTHEISGAANPQNPSTSNRMEMLASIQALEHLATEDGCDSYEIWIATDSKYLAENFKYAPSWRDRNWTTFGYREGGVEPGPVKNQDLWERLLVLSENLNFKFMHIERDTHLLNSHADKLANDAAHR